MHKVIPRISFVLVISLFISILATVVFFMDYQDALGSDFVSFLTGARILKDGKGKFLYDIVIQYEYQKQVTWPHQDQSVLPYVNFPVFAVFFIPFTYLSLILSYKVFVLVLLGILLTISFFSKKIFLSFRKKTLPTIFPFIFYPIFGSAFIAQSTPLLILNFMLIFYLIKKQKYWVAGVLTGLLLLKIQYIIIFPYLLIILKNKKDYIKGFLISLLVIFLTSVLITKGNFLYDYFKLIFYVQEPQFGTRFQDMFSLHAGLSQIKYLSKYSFLDLFKLNAALYLFSILIFYKINKSLSLSKNYATVLLLTLIFSVHAIEYDYALVILPIYILLDKLYEKKKLFLGESMSVFILIISSIFTNLENSTFMPFVLIATVILMNLKKPSKSLYFVSDK